jgi:FSR family fosmidomycin resistance protein-like MFS transporter
VNTSDAEPIPFRRRVRSVATLSLGHAINDSYGYVLQTVLPAIIPALGLTLGMAGSLVSVYTLTSSLIQPAVGFVADRTALRWPAWAGIALTSVAAGLLGLAPNYLTLVLLLIVGGTGSAIFHPVSAAMVGASSPASSRGRWLGLYVTAGNFGLAVGPWMAATLVRKGDLAGMWPIMLPGLAVAGIVGVFAPRARTPTQRGASLAQVLGRHGRVLSALVLVTGLRALASAAMVTFIPLLATARGASLEQAALALTGFLFFGAVGGLIGGFVSDRFGRDRTIIASLLLSVPFGLYLALVPSTGWDFAFAAAANGLLLNGSFVVMTVRGQESVPGSVGMVTGLMLGLSIGLGGLAVTPIALLAERIGLPAAAALSALMAAAAAAAMVLVPREVPRRASG